MQRVGQLQLYIHIYVYMRQRDADSKGLLKHSTYLNLSITFIVAEPYLANAFTHRIN